MPLAVSLASALAERWRFLHAVGKWFASLRDFLANSDWTLAVANTCTVCLRRVRNRIHSHILVDALAGRQYTNSDMHQMINRCGTFRFLPPQRRSWTPITTTYCHLIEYDEVAMSMAP
jgi:hypothetical protein